MPVTKKLTTSAAGNDVKSFLNKIASTPNLRPAGRGGRLVFGMDATASRMPTWEQARRIQGEMFEVTEGLGGIEIQLCYYFGLEQFFATPWMTNPAALRKFMNAVRCVGGYTQVEKLLAHTREETRRKKVDALVFVGDCMEEDVERLCQLAGQLGLLNVPAFLFHEGNDPIAQSAFRQIASLTRGAYCRFDASSAGQLRDLLRAVAVYAAGGRKALQDFSKNQPGPVLQLTRQLNERG